ncbi:MAG: type III pantothenate kinase [Anaerolineales bacterium]|nr:type III pantothenate kinase [Anaerolineales bacterium]
MDTQKTQEGRNYLLAVDIGNTNITLGIYLGDQREAAWRLATDHDRMPDEYGLQILGLLEFTGVTPADLKGVALASVVPSLTRTFIAASSRYLDQQPFVVDETVKTGIQIKLDQPHTIGADRIVDAVAVMALYGGPACVVDFGTATTFDAITREGDYLGGAISPGVGIAADALFQRAAKLSRVDLAFPPDVIGSSTIHAVQSGLMYGYVSLVEGMVARFRTVLGEDMKVIGTGGLVSLISAQTDAITIEAPWLTLDGLRMLWDMNRA